MVLTYNCAKFGALAQRVTIIPLSDCTKDRPAAVRWSDVAQGAILCGPPFKKWGCSQTTVRLLTMVDVLFMVGWTAASSFKNVKGNAGVMNVTGQMISWSWHKSAAVETSSTRGDFCRRRCPVILWVVGHLEWLHQNCGTHYPKTCAAATTLAFLRVN